MTRRARSLCQSWRLSEVVHASSDLPATLIISSFPLHLWYVNPPILLHQSMFIGPPVSHLTNTINRLKTKASGRGPNNSQNIVDRHAGIPLPKARLPELNCSSKFATCEYITKPRSHKSSQVPLRLPSWS